jgi:hypothetical protein
MENKNQFIEIFAGKVWQSTMIKDLLTDNGIYAFIDNEHMSVIDPNLTMTGFVVPIRVKVQKSEFAKAQKLIEEFNSASFSFDEEPE